MTISHSATFLLVVRGLGKSFPSAIKLYFKLGNTPRILPAHYLTRHSTDNYIKVANIKIINCTQHKLSMSLTRHRIRGAPRHKRHKHKKHKKRRVENEFDSDTSIEVAYEDPMDKPYKSKAKVNKEPVPGTSAADLLKAQAMKSSSDSRKSVPGSSSSTPPKAQPKKKKKSKDSGTSSEEERWLDAIKSGKLEEVDEELKKIKPKDPKMMTARQRAMYERGTDKETSPGGEVLLALPSGYKEKVMTAEAIQKAALKSQKRKQLADEKREKDKKKTMDRLLKKQESKNLKNQQKNKIIRKQEPMIVYKNKQDFISLSLPVGIPFPLDSKPPIEPPKPVLCEVAGCENIKRYNCSKTGVPLCSFECYKANLATVPVQ